MIVRNKMPVLTQENLLDSWKTGIEETLERYGRERAALLPCLKIIQKTSGYITPEAVSYLQEIFNLPASKVYSVASFYGMLTYRRQGKYVIRLCDSVACHINDSRRILDCVERELGIKPGETTPDYQFTLEVVPCLGLCDKAPGMMINENIMGPLTEESVKYIFTDLKENG